MAIPATQNVTLREKSAHAWGISLFVHLLAIGLLGVVLHPWRDGAAQFGDPAAMGILITHSKQPDGVRAGDGGQGDTAELEKVFEPPALAPMPSVPPYASQQSSYDPYTVRTTPVRLAAAPVSAPNQESTTSRGNTGVGRSGSPGGTGYAQTSVFGVEGKGNKFVYLFDRSASMDGAPLSAAKRQLLESLRSLDSVHQFQIVFFNSRTRVFEAAGGGRRVAFASDRNKQLAANFVGGITADGGTDRMVALREAIAMSPNVIFFLSDADDPMSASELAEVTRLNQRAQAAISVIEFGRKPAPTPNNFLMQLAKESGGQYGYIDTATLKQPAGTR
jgi:von Willebrand factor type A domain